MKNILLTGASGFIGRNILRYFLKSNYFVYAIGKKKPKINNKKFKFIKLDLKKKILFKKRIKFFCIVHTAAISPNKSIKDIYLKNYNIKSTRNLAKYAISNQIKKFIFLSSVSVYGKILKNVINKNSKINKPSAYGYSKFLNEKYLNNEKLNVISIRLPGVVGKFSKRNLLTRILKIKKNIIYAFNKEKLFNNVIHVENLCKFIVSLCNKKFKKGNTAILVSAKSPIPFNKVLDIIVKRKKILYKNNLMNSFTIDNSYAIKKFNFKPWTTSYTLKKFVKENLK